MQGDFDSSEPATIREDKSWLDISIPEPNDQYHTQPYHTHLVPETTFSFTFFDSYIFLNTFVREYLFSIYAIMAIFHSYNAFFNIKFSADSLAVNTILLERERERERESYTYIHTHIS